MAPQQQQQQSEVESRMLPAITPVLESTACLGTTASTPLIALAKWAIIHPLIAKASASNEMEHDLFAKLHVGILECLADVKQKRSSVRGEVVNAKKVNILVNEVRVILDNYMEGWAVGGVEDAATQETLDRLGQFLSCLVAAKCVHGRMDEVIDGLKTLPQNAMISILLSNLT